MVEQIFLKMDWPNWVVALLLLGLAALAYFYYLRTLPPLSRWRRTLATTLRAVSVGLIFFLILQPVLQLLHKYREKPVVAVLIDNSASMNIPEGEGLRGDSLRYLLRELPQNLQNDSLAFNWMTFAMKADFWKSDSLRFAADGTNIAAAIATVIDSLSRENLQAIVLLSDGSYNQGANPLQLAQSSPVPIFPVLIGDPTVPRDIAIRRVQTNQVTYVNKELPVEVVFWHNGYAGQRAVLTVSGGGRQLARKPVTLGQSGFEQKETLTIIAGKPGDENFEVAIQALPEEVTTRNNRQLVRVKVLKSKLRVLVLSGAPSFDRQFLSFSGRQLPDYAFTFRTEISAGRYYEGDFQSVPLDSQDLVVLQGFPTAQSDADQVRRLLETVRGRQTPLLWFIEQSTSSRQAAVFGDLLPFELRRPLTATGNRLVRLTGSGGVHPVARIDENETVNALLWQELPPLEVYNDLQARSGSHVILEAAGGANQPASPAVCYAFRQQEIKQLVFNGANFSNWHFQLQDDPARDRFWLTFLDRAIRWLVNRDDINQIQIKALQQIYNVGETVTFSGQVYDAFYRVLDDANVVVRITNDSLSYTDEMISEGNGFYRQSFSGLPEGEYRYSVTAQRNDEQIGVRRGRISVKPFFLEFQQVAANHSLLRELASVTNGAAYNPAQFIREFPKKRFDVRTQYSFSEFFLKNYWYWLAALIFLLGTEWFLRKRWGLL